jgi:hypothetical protein
MRFEFFRCRVSLEARISSLEMISPSLKPHVVMWLAKKIQKTMWFGEPPEPLLMKVQETR